MKGRSAFTLFELILAIALSATLLSLIGTAVNLYLMRIDTSRMRIEEAQLARSILATIAADVRAATPYQTQDISTVAQLAVSAAAFNVDDIDSAAAFSAGALGSSSGTGAGTTSSAASDQSSSTSTGLSTDGALSTTALVPGLNGLLNELMLDVARLPRLDELFPTTPQSTLSNSANAARANLSRPSDMKTVRFFIRQGNTIDPSDASATGLASAAQQVVGGLVRQTVDRSVRQMAEQAGNSQLLESGQVLLAPEVTQIQFRYFDGTTAVESWNMQERSSMPTAIEVRIWLMSQALSEQQQSSSAASSRLSQTRMYSQTIDLPLAQVAGATTASTVTDEESAGSETGSTGTSTGTGFGVGASGN